MPTAEEIALANDGARGIVTFPPEPQLWYSPQVMQLEHSDREAIKALVREFNTFDPLLDVDDKHEIGRVTHNSVDYEFFMRYVDADMNDVDEDVVEEPSRILSIRVVGESWP